MGENPAVHDETVIDLKAVILLCKRPGITFDVDGDAGSLSPCFVEEETHVGQ